MPKPVINKFNDPFKNITIKNATGLKQIILNVNDNKGGNFNVEFNNFKTNQVITLPEQIENKPVMVNSITIITPNYVSNDNLTVEAFSTKNFDIQLIVLFILFVFLMYVISKRSNI
jgi:hypothetical protein